MVETLEARTVLAPVIHEFLAVNKDGLLDADGDASDWIEIHESAAADADLTNWYLTDDPANLAKWQFPATSLAAGGYLVVFASGKDRRVAGSALHTNFKLDGAGEYLALVQPDGTTIASEYSLPLPEQVEDTSFGVGVAETLTPLVKSGDTAAFLVPDAAFDTRHGATWNGSAADFDDSTAAGWTAGTVGLGYDANREVRPTGIDGKIAYQIPRGTPGDQAIAGSLGMDFVVTRPITLTSLGAFDDGSNGFRRTISVQLWQRDDRGTLGGADDLGVQVLASATFNSTSGGSLLGGSRFKALAQPLVLQPGSYTIVASGYGSTERNGVAAAGGGFGTLASSDAVQYVGTSRYNAGATTGFPGLPDLGPANRYGAGTFTFVDTGAAEAPSPNRSFIAANTTPGVGDASFAGVIGMDFLVSRPIQITELGVFDSGLDGITGTLAVSIWQRFTNVGNLLADRTFIANAGRIEPGTGSRFLTLDQPLVLGPGNYTVVASGFLGTDFYSTFDSAAPHNGTTQTGDGAIQFLNSSRWALDPLTFFSAYRSANAPFHTFPDRPDTGPANKYAAGTFKFELLSDVLIDTHASPALNVNGSTYIRVPFDVPAEAQFEALRLNMNYDDGFVAYLNGVEVARRNAPAAVAWNSNAAAGRGPVEPYTADVIDLTAQLPLLRTGRNILALQGLNASPTDLDFLQVPQLVGVDRIVSADRFFTTPTPGAANGIGALGRVGDTNFSIDRRIIEAADLNEQGELVVEIMATTADSQIYYTADGSVPSPANGTLYTTPLRLTRSTTLRAKAFKEGFLSSNTDTQTYLFLADVINLGGPPAGYPTHWNGVAADYGISQNPADLRDIVGNVAATDEEIRTLLMNSLRSLPTFSIVADPEDLFGPATGLYSNPFGRDRAWERAASIEYLPADGSRGFQIDAGLQMQGWTSRIPVVTPKHSLQIVFREEYGEGRLNYQLFPDSPVASFDTFSLRANNRDTWVSDYRVVNGETVQFLRPQATYIRDEWAKDTLRDLGQISPHGSFAHVYINGVYWGVYNPTERPDADFIASYEGGAETDYDVMRFCNPAPSLVDGQRDKWDQLLALVGSGMSTLAAYQRVQGLNPDGTRNLSFDDLIDLDNLIDYMLVGQYHAGDDWPCNFYAYRERSADSEGFKFITWDDDLAIPYADPNGDTITPGTFCAGVPAAQLPGCQALYGRTPGGIDAVLRTNPEYRLRFADRIQKHLFHGGALSLDKNLERWFKAALEVQPGLVAEAARWGDYRRDVVSTGDPALYTPGREWANTIDLVSNSYFPARQTIIFDQWRAAGLFPDLAAPTYNQHGGSVAPGFAAALSAPTGTIYYTLDGSDPRVVGGAISPTALVYAGPITLERTTTVRARVFDGTNWSPIDDATFAVDVPLRVTELMYNPVGPDEGTEFIELKNIGAAPLDLTGIKLVRDDFGRGVEYEFLPTDTNLTLAPGAYLVIPANHAAFVAANPTVGNVADREYLGNLSNGGDAVTLVDKFGGPIQQFTYDDAWYPETDGQGRTLVIRDATADRALWSDANGWQPSVADGGSPGDDDLPLGDLDGNHRVGIFDLLRLRDSLGAVPGAPAAQTAEARLADVNRDGVVDRGDIAALIFSFGTTYAPSLPPPPPVVVGPGLVASWTPRSTGPTSPAVLASATPRTNWTVQSISTMALVEPVGYINLAQAAPPGATPPGDEFPSVPAAAAAIDVAIASPSSTGTVGNDPRVPLRRAAPSIRPRLTAPRASEPSTQPAPTARPRRAALTDIAATDIADTVLANTPSWRRRV